MLFYATLCYAMLWCAVLCYAKLFSFSMLFYAMLCYGMLFICYAMLCCAILCYLCYAILLSYAIYHIPDTRHTDFTRCSLPKSEKIL